MLLALALSAVLAQPLVDRDVFSQASVTRPWQSTLAQFEAFPASGAGTSGACSTTAPTGSRGESLTFTRATVAECYSNDGQTLTQMAINKARVSSGDGTSWLGLWEEGASQNDLLWVRDLSNAAWTKTNMTCAKTATGMRADANSASTCTATAANATVCQTLTLAAAQRATSWHIKRRTGTDAVTLARDGATYSSDIASQLSASLWKRAVPWDTPGCAGGNCIVVDGLTSSQLNPQICLKLATSGDEVDIDFVQDEASANCGGYCSTSPIETTTVAVPRGAEYSYATYSSAQPMRSFRASVSVAPNLRNLTGLLMSWTADGNNAVYVMKDAFSATLDQNFGCHQYVAGSDKYSNGNQIAMPSASALLSVGCDIEDGATVTSYGRGWSAAYVVGPPGTTVSATYLILGRINGAGYEINGVIKDIAADPTPGIATGRTVYPTTGSPIAWMGDSIPLGTQAAPNRPPYALQRLLSNGKTVYNLGIGGHTAAQCLSDWRDHVQSKGYATVVVHCGVNSINGSVSAVATMADLTTLYDEIRANRRVELRNMEGREADGDARAQCSRRDVRLDVLRQRHRRVHGTRHRHRARGSL